MTHVHGVVRSPLVDETSVPGRATPEYHPHLQSRENHPSSIIATRKASLIRGPRRSSQESTMTMKAAIQARDRIRSLPKIITMKKAAIRIGAGRNTLKNVMRRKTRAAAVVRVRLTDGRDTSPPNRNVTLQSPGIDVHLPPIHIRKARPVLPKHSTSANVKMIDKLVTHLLNPMGMQDRESTQGT